MSQNICEYLKDRFGIVLTQQQLRAVDTIEGPALLLAVPGAGKTTVMVTRIINMVANHGIAPESILTITFSKAGAIDMQKRYETLFGEISPSLPTFCTIHAFCYRVVRSYCQVTGGSSPELIDPIQRTVALRQIYQRINKDFLTEDVEEELISNISFIKNAMLRKEDAEDKKILETQVKNIWEIYQAYNQFKKENGLMDFDDMLSYTLTILRRYPDILECYRERYRYICVDEAQDTSKLQHAIIYLLAKEHRNLFLVGDEDQSIYRFRGACPENLLNFQQLYPEAQVLKMEENFRSTKEIVSHANHFISHNKKRYPKNMFTENEQGIPIQLLRLHDFGDQYRAAIDAYLKEPGTTAIIYRNNLSAIPMADVLDRNDVDFYVREHKVRLKSNYVVADVLSFFSLSYDPNDFESFSRIFYKTAARLKKSMIYDISSLPLNPGESFFDRMIGLCDDNQNTGRIRYIATTISRLKKQPPVEALETILNQIGYLSYLEYSCGSGYSMQAQKLNILLSLASRVKTVEEFLNRIDQMDEIMAVHSQRTDARLTLTTVHSAKGLEFDTVVLLDCMDDIFPGHSAVEKFKHGLAEDMEEEARLFYVGCTRAKNRLVIPYANYSANNPAVPSRFISMLEKEKSKKEKAAGIRLYPGLVIYHKNFGKGQVVNVDRAKGVFTAYFGPKGTRTLTMAILKGGTIKLVPEGEKK